MQKTLTTLLQIAQAEARAPLSDEARVNLGALAQEIGALYEPVVRERGITLRIEAQDAYVGGSRQLLAQLISNLMENALEHAAEGRSIELAVRESEAVVSLHLSDRGRGIPTEDRERALRPFVRLAPARGSGKRPGSEPGCGHRATARRPARARGQRPGLARCAEFQSIDDLSCAGAREGLSG